MRAPEPWLGLVSAFDARLVDTGAEEVPRSPPHRGTPGDAVVRGAREYRRCRHRAAQAERKRNEQSMRGEPRGWPCVRHLF